MITKKDIEHIAHLARIEVSEDEIVKFEKDLGGILKFIDQLKGVDTAGIEPVAGGLAVGIPETLAEETRGDEIMPPLGDPAGLVIGAPRRREGWIEVPAVFD